MELKGRIINGGAAEGTALVSRTPISFFGGVDPETGVVTDKDSDINGRSIAGTVLVFPFGKGSTVGPYTLYRLAANGKAPRAVINRECETIVAVGCIISDIPAIDRIDIDMIVTGDRIRIENDSVLIE
jgi:predicted aconitase with swiveling domain